MLRKLLIPIILFVLIGCSDNSGKTEIGFLGTLSGRYSDIGQDTLKGASLALEELDPGRNVHFDVRDDKGMPSDGLAAMSAFETSGVRYIIGPNLSSVATAAAPFLEGKYMFLLSPSVSTAELAGKDDHFLRTMPHNSARQADVIARYLIDKMKITNMVIIYDSRNSSYSSDIVRKMSDSFMNRGGKIKDIRAFNPDTGESMSKLIEKDRENQPQMYYIVASAMDTALIIWQIRKAQFQSKILIRAWAATNEFFRFGGEAADGVYLFDYYINKDTKPYRAFHDRYVKKYKKEPSIFSIHGHEAMEMLYFAQNDLKQGLSFHDALAVASKKLKLLPEFSFDEYGDSFMPLDFFITENGKVTRIGPAE